MCVLSCVTGSWHYCWVFHHIQSTIQSHYIREKAESDINWLKVTSLSSSISSCTLFHLYWAQQLSKRQFPVRLKWWIWWICLQLLTWYVNSCWRTLVSLFVKNRLIKMQAGGPASPWPVSHPWPPHRSSWFPGQCQWLHLWWPLTYNTQYI